MKDKGFNLLLGVNAGSADPACLIEVQYMAGNKEDGTTALVGKQLRQTKKWCRNGPFQYQKKLPFRKTTTRKTTWKVFLWK